MKQMLVPKQGLIHRDVHYKLQMMLLHSGKAHATITWSYMDPVD